MSGEPIRSSDTPVESFTWGLDALGTIDAAGGGAGGLLWITDHPTSETHLACTDGNANIVNLVSSTTKAVTATYEYTPFGELLRITGSYALANPYRFSSKPQDSETGNYDYGLRSYKPAWGTWLGRDPLGELGGENLYGFIGNDPVNDVDALGLLSLFRDKPNSLSLLTHLRLLGETLSERDTYQQMGNNFQSIGNGIYNGAKGAVDGIASIPEIARFAASEEAREMIDRLINDEDYRNEFAKRMGDSACDFLDKLQTNDGAFEASGELIFSLASGAAALKAIKVAKKLKELIPRKTPGSPRTKARFGTNDPGAIAEFDSVTGKISYNRANIRAEAAAKGTTWRHEARASAFHEHGHKLLNPVNNAVQKVFGLSDQPYFLSKTWMRAEEAVVEAYGQVRARLRTMGRSTK